MSEVQSRPTAPRGRGSARGGRGGFGTRGGRPARGHATNGDKVQNDTAPIEEDAEVAHLKKQYGSKVTTLREMFPDWTDEDVVFALQETDGDLMTAAERISDGTISQWGAVSKNKKDRSRSKATKDTVTTTLGDTTNTRASRGGRGSHDGARGGRGRATERGRAGARGRGNVIASINESRTEKTPALSVPTEESSAWDTAKKDDTPARESSPAHDTWGATAAEAATATVATAAAVTSSIIPDGVKKSWASMFKPAPAPKKEAAPVEKAPEKPAELQLTEVKAPEAVSEPVPEVQAEQTTLTQTSTFETEPNLTPSKDELTETNLEQVLDTSNPAPTATAASTTASSWDPRNGATSGTPYTGLQQSQPQAIRPPPASGFAASALKATGAAPRTPSYNRRVLDQEEAVRMPGNREVDRAAVQFGAFSLGGTGEDDVDGDREEPETRGQPPQHSPVAQPRASLPPASAATESLPTLKEAPGLPAATHPTAAPGLPSPLPSAQSLNQQGVQNGQQYAQFNRFGQPETQKPYDPFSQQAPATQSPYDGYTSQQAQSQAPHQPGAFSSAPGEYSQYYTADNRNAYANYYNQFGQQQGAQGQDGHASQQRSSSSYNASQGDSTAQFTPSSTQQSQSRYPAGESNSGHTTPAPTTQAQGQQPGQIGAQQSHPSQPQGQQYPYGHPYYTNPSYYAAYMNQYPPYGQGGYGAGPYGGKGGMYNQPHGYPQSQYDHSASPATGTFGSQTSLHGRDSALGGTAGEYGRAGSQPSQTAGPLGGGAFGDSYGRGSSYQGQSQQYGQQGAQGGSEDLKPFGENKSANGPSPSLAQAARPGSAANNTPGQSALPPPQSSQGFGGYQGHLQQQHNLHGSQAGTQYGGLGGLGNQGHQTSQYGGYGQGQGFGGNSYYGNNQQRGGWGNNYQH